MQQIVQTPSSDTIGRLIDGHVSRQSAHYRAPITDIRSMAEQLQITFRPLPKGFNNPTILRLREDLRRELERNQVTIIPWDEATSDYHHYLVAPLVKRKVHLKRRAVRPGIHAVIDVERPPSLAKRFGIQVGEALYRLDKMLRPKDRPVSIPTIARLSLWADDHLVWHIQDYMNTQMVMLTELDEPLVSPQLPYSERVALGLATMARVFVPTVIGACGEKLSILNLNLADSIFDWSEIDDFVHHCLIPKLYLPITPLLPGQFDVERYDPRECESAHRVAELGRSLRATELLPDGHKMYSVIKRKSRRDMAKVLVDGRTGVSFGFLAFAEPPRYVGPREISEAEWLELAAVDELPDDEIRRNEHGRYFLRVCLADGVAYRQVPDLWIASSRSGANKTALDIDKDVVRIGYRNGLYIQLPEGVQSNRNGPKPSYDIRVMIAQTLSAALHWPEFIENGASLFHFHGYPHRDWFTPAEHVTGAGNPSVPCGTMEAGVFNFQAIADLALEHGDDAPLACIIEPDHGSNLIARDMDYLIERVRAGVASGQIALGGRHFASLNAQRGGISESRCSTNAPAKDRHRPRPR